MRSTTLTDPASTKPQVLTLQGQDSRQLGVQRGTGGRAGIAGCWDVYRQLFQAHGISEAIVEREATNSLAAIDAWAPHLAAEIRGTAEGADLPVWKVSALNARTEILSLSDRARPGECSTVVSAGSRPFSLQTWDWHEELATAWHLQSVETKQGRFVGLTEYGILAKIGLNDAGVGVHLNVLGHRHDSPGAVPVHVAAAQVLHEAVSLDEAVDILLDAPVQTSSAISVVTRAGTMIVELSPEGAEVIKPTGGSLLHTNHFLAPRLANGEKTELYQPDSQQRIDLLERRVGAAFQPATPQDLVPYLCSVPGDGAELCCVPAPGAGLGSRWATLATVGIDPATSTLLASPGAPTDVTANSWWRLSPESGGSNSNDNLKGA
jgi:isopenicillin-N N-acyltransferase like protein